MKGPKKMNRTKFIAMSFSVSVGLIDLALLIDPRIHATGINAKEIAVKIAYCIIMNTMYCINVTKWFSFNNLSSLSLKKRATGRNGS